MEQPTSSPVPLAAATAGVPPQLQESPPAFIAIGLIVAGIAFTVSWVGLLAYWAIRLSLELLV